MPRARARAWQDRHPRVVGPLLTFSAAHVGRLLEALGCPDDPAGYRRRGFAFRDPPPEAAASHTFGVLADCLAVAGAWRDFRAQAETRPTPGQQLVALTAVRAKGAALRAALAGLDDASRAALSGAAVDRHGLAGRWWDDGRARLLADLADFDNTLALAIASTTGARQSAPPRDKWPGRVEWLWAARAVFWQHAASPQRRQASARLAFLRALADAAGVPLPASDRVLARLLRRAPDDGLIRPTPRLPAEPAQ